MNYLEWISIVHTILILAITIFMFITIKQNQGTSDKHNEQLVKVQYSVALKEFLDQFIADECVKQFKAFKDSHEIALTNKANIGELIEETCHKIFRMLDQEELMLKYSVFSNGIVEDYSFYATYIIDTTTHVMKKLFEKTVDEEAE